MNRTKKSTRPKAPSQPRSKRPSVAIGVTRKTSLPSYKKVGKDSLSVHRREFVTSVSNGTNVGYYMHPLSESIPGLDINPGCTILFPWLSNMARNYERYKITKLKFEMIPSQATTTPGRYYLAVDYDYDDLPAPNKQAMLGNRTASEAPVWQPQTLSCVPAELHRDMPVKFINSGHRANFVEPRTSHCGFLMIAFDSTTTNLLFDLWVDYEIELISPVADDLYVQNALPITYATTSNVLAEVGAQFIGQPSNTRSAVSGPVQVVQVGSLTTPVMNLSTSSQQATFAYDILNARTGALQVDTDVKLDALEPLDIIITGIRQQIDVYDAKGTRLTPTHAIPGENQTVTGITDPAMWATAGSSVNMMTTLFLEQVLSAYPTARYLIPFVLGSTSLGAGSWRTGFRYEV